MKRSPINPKRSTPRRKGPAATRIKPGRVEDPAHLARVRSLPCLICGKTPSEAHHPRIGGTDGPGGAQKAPDAMALPLCSRHHNEQHPDSLSIHRNPIDFRAAYGDEVHLLARTLEALKTQEAA